MSVNNLSKVALDSAAVGIEPAISSKQVQRPNHYATEPHKGGIRPASTNRTSQSLQRFVGLSQRVFGLGDRPSSGVSRGVSIGQQLIGDLLLTESTVKFPRRLVLLSFHVNHQTLVLTDQILRFHLNVARLQHRQLT